MNSVVEFSEFPDNLGTIRAGKYVISQNHEINGSVKFEENVMLYFTTGMLTGTGVLTGNYTNIQAPIAQIFGENLTVGGNWTIDRAYPQWFGAKIVTDKNFSNPASNASDAINRAINMKRTGEVFIPRGEYMVRKTIMVHSGIHLVGEAGSDGTPEHQYQSTILRPMVENEVNKNDFTAGYMMMVNIKDPNNATTPENAVWEVGYIIPVTEIRNMYFSTAYSNLKGLKGILVAGGFVFDTVTWKGLCQAVSTTNNYSDLKKITNCTFMGGDGEIYDKYVFDLSGLGDGLVFEHNAMHDFNAKALKLSECLGGSITANILNGDVLIDSSKDITFTGNHMEGDPQIKLIVANVSLNNNYIEKGKRPSIFLEKGPNNEMPVVELNNNTLNFYDYNRAEKDMPNSILGICEYDICLKGDVILNISNSYRYWIGVNGPGKLYPYGISVCEPIIDSNKNIIGYLPVEKFNRHSPFLTTSCTITPDTVIVNDTYMNDLNIQGLYVVNLNTNSKWYGDIGHSYMYQYSIIWDYDRKILATANNGSSSQSVFDACEAPIFIENENKCVLMAINRAKYVSRRIMVRLYRKDVTVNKTEYVDIPLCGTVVMYDNGVSICGYKWKPFTEADNIFVSVNSGINSIKYNGDIVECRSDSYPTKGKWKKGDVVYNTGTQSTENMWVFKSDTNLG